MLISVLVALPFVLSGPSLPERWWMADDTQILKHAVSHPFWQYFVIPEAWRDLSPNNLTPMLTALYDLDYHFFGARPAGFYLHHLALMAFLAGTVYCFSRLWLSPAWSFFTSALFSLSPCYTAAASFLMLRHYGEGMMWSLCALIFVIKAFRGERIGLAAVGAFFYLLALLNKEVYAPLPLILPFLYAFDTGKSLFARSQIVYYTPFFLVAAGYTGYRRWMLGDYWISGYGAHYASYPDFSTTAEKILSNFYAGHWWLALIIFPLIAWAILHDGPLKKRLLKALFAALLLFLMSMPLVTVLPMLSRRHLFLPTLILLMAASLGIASVWRHGLPGRIVSLVCAGLLFAGSVSAFQRVRTDIKRVSDNYRIQGEFLWSLNSGKTVLLTRGLEEWYIGGLFWLKRHVAGTEEIGTAMVNYCNLLYTNPSMRGWARSWEYDPGQRKIIPMEATTLHNRKAACLAKYRPDEKLDARFWQEGKYIAWELGPNPGGAYFIVSPKTGHSWRIPPRSRKLGNLEQAIREEKRVHVCFTHSDGWTTCSAWEP
ncbi:MAG: hypothetical protein GY864_05875 [Desulfobacterales bacterium]|nr:hypothetical protein [Desulfobacterales bacterium]